MAPTLERRASGPNEDGSVQPAGGYVTHARANRLGNDIGKQNYT